MSRPDSHDAAAYLRRLDAMAKKVEHAAVRAYEAKNFDTWELACARHSGMTAAARLAADHFGPLLRGEPT